ncbi:MAG: periplasmic heavy metal sensor [Deltaproteobacteria bacterium]|nr:periplasmic heavy metal sensor [Deltaproteobacteria bacterium]
MKRDWLIYLVMFSLALNLGTIGTIVYLRYQDPPQVAAGPSPPPLPPKSLWQELKMDESQRQAWRHLFPEHHQQVKAVRQELAQKRQELFDLIKAESAPWSAIQAKVQEISARQGSLEEEMARFMLEFKKNLNPEQHAAFLNLVQTRLGCSPERACGPGSGDGRRRGPGMGPRGRP